jgi:multimeric flavodoxin WrbA
VKVVAINGSARKDGNTAILVRTVLETLEEHGIETRFLQLAGEQVHGCTACMKCRKKPNRRCRGIDDFGNECIEAMDAADGIIIASPVYFTDVTAETKALIDRAGYVSGANDAMFRRKVGAAVVAVRRGGAIHAFDTINHLFLYSQMIVAGSSYWNVGIGRDKGDVLGDEEGLGTMRTLGDNMAWVLERVTDR